MRNVMCLLMIAFLVCGFGYTSKKSTMDDEDVQDSTMKTSAPAAVSKAVTDVKATVQPLVKATAKSTTKAVASAKKSTEVTPPAASAAQSPDAAQMQAVASALKVLAGDNPEQTKARIDALKRLSQAMAKAQQTATEEKK